MLQVKLSRKFRPKGEFVMSIFRFLPGIIIIQAATAALVFVVIETPTISWELCALLALCASFLAAFWFASIADHLKKDAIADLKEKSVRERERLIVSAEKEKSRVFKQTHKQIVKETNRAHAKANFKVGAVVIGAVGAGIGLLSLQFITVGLITLLAAGGALTGYVVRARQGQGALKDKSKTVKSFLTARRKPVTVIEGEISDSDTPRLEKKP